MILSELTGNKDLNLQMTRLRSMAILRDLPGECRQESLKSESSNSFDVTLLLVFFSLQAF